MNRRYIRKRRIIRLAAVLALIVALLVIVFLFQVRKIEVYGNERHSSEEISVGLMNDIIGNNTLYLLWKNRNGGVPDTLPFLDSLEVQMKSPYEILVSVTEKTLAGYVDKGDAVYFDMDGIVLEITDEIYDSIPVVTGATTGDPVLYQKLPTESASQLQTTLKILRLLEYHELGTKEVRFGENMDITVFIGGVEARLGQNECLEEKIANMKSILEKLDATEQGVLHLESFTGGGTENVTFSPADETEAVVVESDAIAAEDGTSSGDTGTGDGTAVDDTDIDSSTADGNTDEGSAEDTSQEDTSSGGEPFMAFDSSGTLRYDVRVVNGQAVDSTGTPVPGCTVNEQGYVVDAYMNVIDPATGQPIQ